MDKICIELISQDVRSINYAPYSAGPKLSKFKEDRNRQNARHEYYRACNARMSTADHFCSEEGRIITFLYRLKKGERCDRQGRLPDPVNRRVPGLFRRGAHVLDITRQFSIQTSRD